MLYLSGGTTLCRTLKENGLISIANPFFVIELICYNHRAFTKAYATTPTTYRKHLDANFDDRSSLMMSDLSHFTK